MSLIIEPTQRIAFDPATDALDIIDATKAFFPTHFRDGVPIGGGGLAVTGAEKIIDPILKICSKVPKQSTYVIRDVHMPKSVSFYSSYRLAPGSKHCVVPFTDLTREYIASWDKDMIVSPHFDLDYLHFYLDRAIDKRQRAWWEHGIVGTDQAELHPALLDVEFVSEVLKGLDPRCDSNSAYRDNMKRTTGLAEIQTERGVKRVFMVGLAFDVCVGLSALDAAKMGLDAYIVIDATASVAPDLHAAMLKQLSENPGIHIITSEQLEII